jgi:hypothetical protein
MMKAHGIAPTAASVKTPSTPRSTKRESRGDSNTPSKKSKLFEEDIKASDDEELFSTPFKAEPSSTSGNSEELRIKDEFRMPPQTMTASMIHIPYGLRNFADDDLSGGSYYEPTTNGYNTPLDGAYSIRHAPRLFQCTDFMGESAEGPTENPAAAPQAGFYPGQSIVISD